MPGLVVNGNSKSCWTSSRTTIRKASFTLFWYHVGPNRLISSGDRPSITVPIKSASNDTEALFGRLDGSDSDVDELFPAACKAPHRPAVRTCHSLAPSEHGLTAAVFMPVMSMDAIIDLDVKRRDRRPIPISRHLITRPCTQVEARLRHTETTITMQRRRSGSAERCLTRRDLVTRRGQCSERGSFILH